MKRVVYLLIIAINYAVAGGKDVVPAEVKPKPIDSWSGYYVGTGIGYLHGDATVWDPFKVKPNSLTGSIFAGYMQMNADSFAAMLRSKVAERGQGKIQFLMPGAEKGADYYLTGQFIAESMKQEGIVNLTSYINLMDERIKNGESLDLYDDSPANVGNSNSGNQVNIVNGDWHRHYPSLFNQLQMSAKLREMPDVTKRFNVMLVKSDEKVAVWEKMVTLEKKITDGTEHADFILSGEISGLSKRSGGTQSDYLLMTMQLVNPDSNEVLWEDGYEVKKSSRSGTVYQ